MANLANGAEASKYHKEKIRDRLVYRERWVETFSVFSFCPF